MNEIEELDNLIRAVKYQCGDASYKLTSTGKLILLRLLQYFKNSPENPCVFTQNDFSEMTGLEYKAVGTVVRQFISSGLLTAVKHSNQWSYYGLSEFSLIDVHGEVYTVPAQSCKLKPKSVENTESKVVGQFYVYVCKLHGVPVYVGKGRESRINHCLSGRSSNSRLNRLVFEHAPEDFQVCKILEGLSENDALTKEREIIGSLSLLGYDLCNREHVVKSA